MGRAYGPERYSLRCYMVLRISMQRLNAMLLLHEIPRRLKIHSLSSVLSKQGASYVGDLAVGRVYGPERYPLRC